MAESPGPSQNPSRDASPAPSVQTPRATTPGDQQGGYANLQTPVGYQQPMEQPGYPGHQMGIQGNYDYQSQGPGYLPQHGHSQVFPNQAGGTFDGRQSSPHQQVPFGGRTPQTSRPTSLGPQINQQFIPPYVPQGQGHFQYASPGHSAYQHGQFMQGSYVSPDHSFSQQQHGPGAPGWYGQGPQWGTQSTRFQPPYQQQSNPINQPRVQTPVLETEEVPKEEIPKSSEPLRCVCVKGVKKKTSKETLELYFESKRSGGGDIEELQIKDGSAFITFVDHETASRVCHKEVHQHDNSTWRVSLHDPSKDINSTNVIVVSGYDISLPKDTLEMYFESNRRSGGGEIADVRMGKGVAYITYKETGVAQKVESREHTLGDKKLKVRLGETAQPRTIAVTGADPKHHLETIQMYFESKKKSGGGDTEDVKVDRNIIYIRFEKEEAFDRVLKKTSHEIVGHKLTVVKADEMILEETSDVPAADDSVVPAVVQVRGFPKDATEDSITLYFENKRKSGGGDIENVSRNDKKGVIMITFESSEVAERVASKQHTLHGQKLQVKLSVPQVMYKDKILLTGVPDMPSEESLIHYLEARTKLDVEGFLYGEEEGDILVFFSQPIKDMVSLSSALKKKPFLDTYLQASEVPQTSSVVVRNLPDDVSEDTVTMYFENEKRSGAGEVEEVNLNGSEKSAIVKLKDPSVAEKVCKRKHTLGKSGVDVSLHFECLGESGGSLEPPCSKIPDPEEIKEVEEYKLKFLAANTSALDKFKNEIAELNGSLDLNLENKLLKVSPIYTKDHKDAKTITKTWTDDVRIAMKAVLDAIVIEQIDVNSEIWPDVEPKMNEFRGHTDMQVFTEEQNWLIIVAGPKEKVVDTAEKVKIIVTTIQTESDRRKNQIREKKSVSAGKLRVIIAKGTIQKMVKEYLKVTCNDKTGDVEFTGPSDDVHNAIYIMYESLHQVSEQTITSFKPDEVELLRRPKVALHLEKKQKNLGKAATGSWTVGRDEIIVHYPQENGLDEILDFLRVSVKETVIKLVKENIPLLASKEFQEEVEKLRKDRDDRVIIAPQADRSRILITAITEDMDYTITAVRAFIQGHTIFTEDLKYSQPVLKFIVMHCKDKLDSICQDLNQYCVKFDCHNNDPVFKITLKATEDGMRQANMFLNPIAGQVKCHQEVLKKLGINSYIEAGNVLQQVERNSRCVISKTADVADQSTSQHYAGGQGYYTAFTCTPDLGKTISVVVGNMVALASNVEAVIVETTSDLEPDSNQASAVIGKAGDRVMAETKSYARSSQSVLEGEIYSSSAGHLSCKLIIHAVGPTSGSHVDPSDIVKSVILTSLEEAQKNNAKSVAFPAFNTDSIQRQMSSDDCFRYIIESIKSFFDENPVTVVNSVYLCIEDNRQCQPVWNQCTSLFGKDKVNAKQTEVKVEREPSFLRKRRRAGRERRNLSGPQAIDESLVVEHADVAEEEIAQPSLIPAAFTSEPRPMAKPRILLVKADMGVEEADVIVSSSNTNLDLNRGMVSRSLLLHAGQSIQAECQTKYPNGIQTGDIAVTKGGDMQCVEQIYHCVLPNWDANTGKQTLIDTLNALLLKADQGKWKTMAIPALGTGNLGYARDLVAQIMYETVRQFGKDNPDTTINDVLFIVYPGDKESCQIFETENRKHIEAMGGKVASTLEEVESEREQEMVAYRQKLIADKERRHNPVKTSKPAAAQGGFFSGLKKLLTWQREEESSEIPDFYNLSRSASSSDVTLWFYSDDYSNVQKAVEMIYSDMESKEQTKIVEDATLKQWTADQIQSLQELEDQYAVTIKPNKHLGRIVVSGLLHNLSEAVNSIYQMIRDVEKRTQENAIAEELKKVVQWYYVEIEETTGSDLLVPYEALINAKLEKAFTNENKKKIIFDGFVFDFGNWVEYPVDNQSDQLKIIRKDLLEVASSKPPDTWENTNDDISVKQVSKGTPEYQTVEKNITDSFGGATVEIIRIDRVQNTTLYQQYQAKRHQLESQSPGVQIEKMLWHGTKQENGMNIYNYGFNRSYCDKTQSTYGEGVYFTTTAQSAAQDCYSPADSQGKRHIFQSKVLTGTFTKGQSSMRVLPARDPNKPTQLYDSVVDDPANPTTFVIFSDTQAYPEYLITVKC